MWTIVLIAAAAALSLAFEIFKFHRREKNRLLAEQEKVQ
jgi:hypothetical protein